jgi:nitroreductase
MPDTATALDDAAKDALFHAAHSAFRFTGDEVTDAQLRELYALTRLSPTAVNSTPLRIVYVRSAEAKARLLPLLAEGNRAKSESASVVAILAADLAFLDHMDRLAPHIADPTKIFPDHHAVEQAAMFNAALQAGAFIIAVRALGLDAGPMNGIDTAGIDAEFLGGASWRSFMVVNIGRATEDGTRPRGARLEFDEAVSII